MRDNVKTRVAQLDKFDIVKCICIVISQNFTN